MMRWLIVSVALAVIAPADAAAQPATLFRDVRVFDGVHVTAAADVLVVNGRIARVGRGITAPTGAAVVDGRGRTLLPGFFDAHTHVFPGALEEALAFGVTTQVDLFSDVSTTVAARRAQEADGAPMRADVFTAGTLVTAPGGHGTQFGLPIPTITDPVDAADFVDARLAEGSDFIKIIYEDGSAYDMSWPTVDQETMAAVIRATHARDRVAVVHVSTAGAARHALEAGADGLAHVFVDRPVDEDLVRLAARSGAFLVPTLVVLQGMTGQGGAAGLVDDPRFAPYLGPQARQMLTRSFPARPGADRQYGFAAEATRRFHEAGVPILAGSDAPNPGTAHGAALHRELELLVEAGLTPVAALQAATSRPAAAFGLDDRGRIAEGLRADLVLVDGDPTTDIAATRDIRGVWKAGVKLDREAFAARVAADLERARTRAAEAGNAMARGLISDFETGDPATEFGTDWYPSTDAMMGGSSTVAFEVAEGGAGGSAHSLRITGTIAGDGPNAWSGVMWAPGDQPMQARDLSAKAGLQFATRGDNRTYAVLLFTSERGFEPVARAFVAPTDWTEVAMPWSDFGVDGSAVMGIVIVATTPAGDFEFQIDDVRIY